jgi:hypothetical protein
MSTKDPAYWAAKRDDAERRVRLAARELTRLTTPSGSIRNAVVAEDIYPAALAELLLATRGYEGVLSATPREYR